MLCLDVKIPYVTVPSHTEESARLVLLKELYWELYYAHLKSQISDYEQHTGQLKVVKSFSCNTPQDLKMLQYISSHSVTAALLHSNEPSWIYRSFSFNPFLLILLSRQKDSQVDSSNFLLWIRDLNSHCIQPRKTIHFNKRSLYEILCI